MNKVILVGRLARDPFLGETSSEKDYARITLAVRKEYIVPNSQKTADFIPCIAWNKKALFVRDYLTKGMLISLEASISYVKKIQEDKSIKNIFTLNIDKINILESKATIEARQQANNKDINNLNYLSDNDLNNLKSFKNNENDLDILEAIENNNENDVDDGLNWDYE